MKKGLTFKTLVGTDDLQKEFELVMEEHRELIRLVMNGNYGIVSQNALTEDSPMYPVLNESTLYVSAGKAVTPNGDVVTTEEFSIDVGNITADTAVLFVYEMVGSREKRVTNDGSAAPVWYEQKAVEKSVHLVNASEYYNLLDSVRDNCICICVIKHGTTENYVELSNSEYAYNRPRFSPVDISHREEMGTGSSTVPHAIGINDLSSSNVTLYNQLLSRGMIVSKDVSVAGIAGKSYKTYKPVDSDGTVRLGMFPNAVGYVNTHADGLGKDVAAHLVKGTDKLVVDDSSSEVTSVGIDAIVTKTLMPPVYDSNTITTDISFGAEENGDIVISEGQQVTVVNTDCSFANCGSSSQDYEVVLSGDGMLHKEPDVLGFSMLVAKTSERIFNQEYSVPVRVKIALDNAATGTSHSELSLKVEVYGLDENGDELSEVLVWNDAYSLVKTTAKSLITTDSYGNVSEKQTYFRTVTGVRILRDEGTKVSNGCKMTCYACAKESADSRLRIALVHWDGASEKITSVRDIRPIATTLRDPFDVSVVKETGKSIAIGTVLNSIVKGMDRSFTELVIAEDFSDCEYLDTKSVSWRITPDGISYPIISKEVSDTRGYTDCYRSRRIDVNGKKNFYALVLIGADKETCDEGSVRIGTYGINGSEEKYDEYTMKKGPEEGMFFAAFGDSTKDIRYMQVSVTGRAAGFVLIRLSMVEIPSKFKVDTVVK